MPRQFGHVSGQGSLASVGLLTDLLVSIDSLTRWGGDLTVFLGRSRWAGPRG